MPVLSIADDDIVPPPSVKTGFENRYVRGIGKSGSKVQLLVDCEKLLEEHDLEKIEKNN